MPAFDKNLQTLLGIMIFYSLITFFLFPSVGYYLKKSDGIFYGMILGALASIVLWKTYGSKMIKMD